MFSGFIGVSLPLLAQICRFLRVGYRIAIDPPALLALLIHHRHLNSLYWVLQQLLGWDVFVAFIRFSALQSVTLLVAFEGLHQNVTELEHNPCVLGRLWPCFLCVSSLTATAAAKADSVWKIAH